MIVPHAQRLASEGEGNIEMPSRNRNATLNSLLGMARPRLRLGIARSHAPYICICFRISKRDTVPNGQTRKDTV